MNELAWQMPPLFLVISAEHVMKLFKFVSYILYLLPAGFLKICGELFEIKKVLQTIGLWHVLILVFPLMVKVDPYVYVINSRMCFVIKIC